jgi:2-polyprenyl-3-methyl-5-hydroxy-6-metoxy-1,4-benzoquinol methylase
MTTPDSQQDLTSSDHWSNRYDHARFRGEIDWFPNTYDALVIEKSLSDAIVATKPLSILEVGCGNSVWLPYLAKKFSIEVAGVDYSEKGCLLAQDRLDSAGIPGKIFCKDIFKADLSEIGQFDFVFSLGLVEHYTNLEGIIITLAKFVKPGGSLFTEIPNMKSFHGFLSWIWQPSVLKKHIQLTLSDLQEAYQNIKLEIIQGKYTGLFSLDIVAWGLEPRWPKLEQKSLPFIKFLVRSVDKILSVIGWYTPIFNFFAPFLYIVGKKIENNLSDPIIGNQF